MKVLKAHPFFIIVFVLFVSLIFKGVVMADGASKILILPFNIYSEKDISFLKNGIWDMLSTRLANEDKIVILSRKTSEMALENLTEPINTDMAVSAGQKVFADYVLFGSLTVFGDAISTDARFIHIPTQSAAVAFNQSGRQHGDVILHISDFAAKINSDVFDTKVLPQPVAQKTESVEISRMNPEKLWEMEKNKGSIKIETATPSKLPAKKSATKEMAVATPPPPLPKPVSAESPGFWKSSSFKLKIKGVAVGDVDGDQNPEVVFISQKDVHIYRLAGRRLEKIDVIKGKRYSNLISVDLADINGNGRAEIFVSNYFTNNAQLSSFVLEWGTNGFETVSEREEWYFRVISEPGSGPVLLGQKQSRKDEFFSGPVHELSWINGKYVSTGTLMLPQKINLYEFSYGDALNDNRRLIMTYAKDDRIRILDDKGDEEWISIDRYGGGGVCLEFPFDRNAGAQENDRYYIPQRILVDDLDNDGKNEIVVVKNVDAAGQFFKRFRRYKTGHIETLQWKDIGLDVTFKTTDISGYISDYAVADIDNDGYKELIYAVVAKSGMLFPDDKSFLVAQDIPLGD